MKKNIILKITGLLLLAVSLRGYADAVPVPAPPQIAAESYILMDFNSGTVLADKNSSTRLEPASITKLMTAYVIYHELKVGRIKLEDMVIISEKAWRMGGSRMYVEVGKQVSIHDLLQGIIIQSGNDATVALAEHVAGSEEAFVLLMNQYAHKLGMLDTTFTNSTGWPDPQHLTTGKDIAILSAAIIREFPDHYSWYAEKEYSFNNIRQYNRNKLLWRDASIDGLKTGHTESAGYCLATSAKRADMRLITVVFGTSSEEARATASQTLLNYGFRFYETHKLYTAGEQLKRSRVWGGEDEEIALGLGEDFYITIARGSYKNLQAVMDVDANLEAPVRKGTPLGAVRVMLNDKELSRVPLVALQNIAEGSLIRKAKDFVLRMLNKEKL